MRIFERIIHDKYEEVTKQKKDEGIAELKKKISNLPPTRDFKGALVNRKVPIGIIAEIKAESPSVGKITDQDPIEIAEAYENSEAVAISVLTDRHFAGTLQLMDKVKRVTSKPILRKDFIVDEYQLYQSRAYGADAVLLISHLFNNKEEMSRFIKISKELGMDCLVEFHSVEHLEKIPAEAEIYGINNRDLLGNFQTDPNVTFDRIKHIPKGKIIISESGIREPGQLVDLEAAGVSGVLIGTGLLKEEDLKMRGFSSPSQVITYMLSGFRIHA